MKNKIHDFFEKFNSNISRGFNGTLKKQVSSNLFEADYNDVTVILTVWKRNHLAEQLAALLSHKSKPYQVWVYQCGNYVDIKGILKKYPNVEVLHSTINLKYFGRFALAQFVESEYIWILDDDVIPGDAWLENSLRICRDENAIITSAGRIIPKGDYLPEKFENMKKYYLGDVGYNLPYNYCPNDSLVDFGCNSWFFKTKWIKSFWQVPVCTMETAEDMHLSAACKVILNVRTIVPKQLDITTTGNITKAYGRDTFASWMKPDFQSNREKVLRYLIDDQGWKPILW